MAHIPAATNYGFGWSTTKTGFAHTGSDGTASFTHTGRGLIVLVFTQTPSAAPLRKRYYEAVLRACVE